MRVGPLCRGKRPGRCLFALENVDIWALLPLACCPKGKILHASRDQVARKGRETQPSPAGPTLPFLRSYSEETLVRQLSSCWGRKFFPLYPSALLIGWYPAEPGVRKSPTAWAILLNWLHSIPRRAEQWKAGHRRGWEAVWSLTKWETGPETETERRYQYFDPCLSTRRFNLKEMVRGSPWVKLSYTDKQVSQFVNFPNKDRMVPWFIELALWTMSISLFACPSGIND